MRCQNLACPDPGAAALPERKAYAHFMPKRSSRLWLDGTAELASLLSKSKSFLSDDDTSTCGGSRGLPGVTGCCAWSCLPIRIKTLNFPASYGEWDVGEIEERPSRTLLVSMHTRLEFYCLAVPNVLIRVKHTKLQRTASLKTSGFGNTVSHPQQVHGTHPNREESIRS